MEIGKKRARGRARLWCKNWLHEGKGGRGALGVPVLLIPAFQARITLEYVRRNPGAEQVRSDGAHCPGRACRCSWRINVAQMLP